MPILGPNAEQSVIGRILLATGLGAIFGFQVCRLAELGFAASVPWYALAWLFLSYVFLGLSVGAGGSTRWWKRGLVFGLVFSIPSAFGAHALGLRWAPYGVAAITAGLVVGLLIAFVSDALFPRTRTSTDQRSPVSERPGRPGNAKSESSTAKTIRQRIAEEKACLEHLDTERERRDDSGFGKTTEDRIIWGELIELELQDIDEQVNRICCAAGRRRRTSTDSNMRRREGGPHGRNDS